MISVQLRGLRPFIRRLIAPLCRGENRSRLFIQQENLPKLIQNRLQLILHPLSPLRHQSTVSPFLASAEEKQERRQIVRKDVGGEEEEAG